MKKGFLYVHTLWTALLLLSALGLTGQTINTWTGAGTNDFFSNAANWVGSTPGTGEDESIFRFGAETNPTPNFLVALNQNAGGNPPAQRVGRFEFTSGAGMYQMNTVDDRIYRLFGTPAGGSAPVGEYVSIRNLSGVNQTFNTRITQEAPGGSSPIEYNVYDAGTGGLTFNRTVSFRNNAKDLVLRGSGDINFTNIDNTTGANATVIIESTGTVAVSGTFRDVRRIDIRSGTLLMTGSGFDVINDSDNNAKRTSLIMSGGTFALGGSAPQTASFFGTLTLTADSVIDFGSANSTIRFADSSGVAWNPDATLTILNWDGEPTTGGGLDQLFFGENGSGLTAAQRAQIVFANYPSGEVIHLSDGEVVPVPEPAAVAAGVGLLAFLGWRERKRLKLLCERSRLSLAQKFKR